MGLSYAAQRCAYLASCGVGVLYPPPPPTASSPHLRSHAGEVEVVPTNVIATGDVLGAKTRVERVAFLFAPAAASLVTLSAGAASAPARTPVMVVLARRADPTRRFGDEMSLQFWEWDGRAFVQNTCVEGPHGAPVTALTCHPHAPLVVTGSLDCRFKAR